MKKTLWLLAILVILIAVGATFNLLPKGLSEILEKSPNQFQLPAEKTIVATEESIVTKVVADALPSVVTLGISKTTTTGDTFEINPLDPFTPFKRVPGKQQKVESNIGSGFIISQDGLVITNKHVVVDTEATYRVLTNNKKEYSVAKIYRDPLNDLAILKINASGLKALQLGDSSRLKLGQLAIVIGTPLGEFTNTVTVGIVSGLGRGITAGSPFEGFVEKLDNVIQTDAAISPGNSGGPLLNSSGQVIGVNAAIASSGQNIGFAIPSNVVKNLIDNFQKRGGSFERPYIGVRYKMVDKQTAVLNNVAEGAYVVSVIAGSPAQKAGLQEEDIIIEFDGKKVNGSDEEFLNKIILDKKIGDSVSLKVWRNGKTLSFTLTLEASK